jgi:cAMP phosphodiesterase
MLRSRTMRRSSAVVGFILALAFTTRAAGNPAPAFELRALGVLGGDWDENLSSYLLSRPGQPATIMIDGGSVMTGVVRALERDGKLSPSASWSVRVRAAQEFLRPVRALLLTHSHLDHVGGFLDKTTLDLALAQGGRPPLEIIGLPETVDAIHRVGLAPPLWADFTTIPAGNPALRLAPLSPFTPRDVGGFTVRAIPLVHPVPSAAFLVTTDGSDGAPAYLHLGDTSASTAVWESARPLLRAGRLRAVAIEVSFPSREEALAARSGHLTPRTLVIELAKLAGLSGPLPAPEGLIGEDVRRLAARVAPGLAGLPIVILHIKALAYDDVVAELAPLRAAGLHLIVPVQGETYAF